MRKQAAVSRDYGALGWGLVREGEKLRAYSQTFLAAAKGPTWEDTPRGMSSNVYPYLNTFMASLRDIITHVDDSGLRVASVRRESALGDDFLQMLERMVLKLSAVSDAINSLPPVLKDPNFDQEDEESFFTVTFKDIRRKAVIALTEVQTVAKYVGLTPAAKRVPLEQGDSDFYQQVSDRLRSLLHQG